MNQKGFTTPQILIFILALAVVVGGYLVFGTKPQTPTPQEQTPTSTLTQSDAIDNSALITFIVPKGGEIYKAGQIINIDWKPILSPVSKIQLVSNNTNGVVWGIYGGDLEPNITPISSGHFNYAIPNGDQGRVTPGVWHVTITSNGADYLSDNFTIIP